MSNHEYLDENMSTKLIKYYEDNHEFVLGMEKKVIQFLLHKLSE